MRHSSGTVVDVDPLKAKRLAATGSWLRVDKNESFPVEDAPQLPGQATEEDSEGDDTGELVAAPVEPTQPQEEVSAAPSIPEMRKWALENEVEGVKPKGKLPRSVIEAYQKAHEK